MTRPIATFVAAARGIRVRVRVLPTPDDVDAESRGGLPRTSKRTRHAQFKPRHEVPLATGTIGTITLPAVGPLLDLVPHEVTHAVMHDLRAACHTDDEELATAVGLLSAAIFSGLQRNGVTVQSC